jgi:hypothetical protein
MLLAGGILDACFRPEIRLRPGCSRKVTLLCQGHWLAGIGSVVQPQPRRRCPVAGPSTADRPVEDPSVREVVWWALLRYGIRKRLRRNLPVAPAGGSRGCRICGLRATHSGAMDGMHDVSAGVGRKLSCVGVHGWLNATAPIGMPGRMDSRR